jgi:superfamily I DNA/RNA helicase
VGRPFEQLADDARNETLLGYRSALHGNGPEIHAAASEEAELDALADRVRLWTDNGVSPGEIGVTTRFNRGVEKALARLAAAGIPAAKLRADAPDGADAVRVGTMHSFKGLEFRCVAVTGVSADALPAPKAVTPVELDRIQHEADLLSERCLLFVACTRARDGLYVSWTGEPSRFLAGVNAAG